jgi:hypothetical protein
LQNAIPLPQSTFSKTLDDRYVLKRVPKVEKMGFLQFAPGYFEHMAAAIIHGLPTALVKIVGVFRFVGGVGGGSGFKYCFLVLV